MIGALKPPLHAASWRAAAAARPPRVWLPLRGARPASRDDRARCSSNSDEHRGAAAPDGAAPGYDPAAAAGFIAPQGEPQLWWVEQYEAKRRSLTQGAQGAGPQQEAADQTGSSSAPPSAQPRPGSAVGSTVAAALQLLQLVLVTAALILWPASLQPGGLLVGRVWLLYLAYLAFFSVGTLRRIVQHGQLAPRSQDRQVSSSWVSRFAFAAFVVAVPLLHWMPLLRYTGGRLSYSLTAYDVLGSACVLGAICLTNVASQQLGKAYDRVVAPDKLVTSGVYRFVQHPIYTSYILLFCGFCLCLHSAPSALLMLLVCAAYYRNRCRLEEQVLREAFGREYEDYSKATKMFVPFLL